MGGRREGGREERRGWVKRGTEEVGTNLILGLGRKWGWGGGGGGEGDTKEVRGQGESSE